VEDKVGMGVAIVFLEHSLDPGVTEIMVQYSTARKNEICFGKHL
jgi:hypothetical protein